MKYWRGYLVAAFLAIATFAITPFAAGHRLLIDMVYPYMVRMLLPEVTAWSNSVDFCLWQTLLLFVIGGVVLSIVLMILLRWDPIQWFGWILALSCLFTLLNTGLFSLGQYATPMAEDLLMEMQDYSADALEDAALYYRDKANVLSRHINRDDSGVIFSSFEDLNKQAGEGFRYLTYNRGFAIFSGDTSPVKELGWSDLYTRQGVTGMTVYLTGESAVNTQMPQVGLPFAICKEMAKRMMIYNDSEANFAAFLASTCHDQLSDEFKYSAYLMAYRAIYNTIASQNSVSAQNIAASLDASLSTLLKEDLDRYNSFFSDSQAEEPDALFTDLLVSWHIQEVVIPMTPVEDTGFDPMDETDDRLQDIVNKVA